MPVRLLVVLFLLLPFSATAQELEQPAPSSPTGQDASSKQPPTVKEKADEKESEGRSTQGQKGTRMFGVLPNYTTVEGANEVAPVTTKQRFTMAMQNSFDPYLFPFVGFVAGLNDAISQDRSWGHGAEGYGKRFAVAMADNTIGNFLTTAVVSSLLRQDPRYFQSGKGSATHRAGYAASRSVITRGVSGHRQFNASEIGGNGIAAVISDAYYPADARSLSDTLTRWGMQVMWDTVSNELKEFWPDIRRKIHKKEITCR